MSGRTFILLAAVVATAVAVAVNSVSSTAAAPAHYLTVSAKNGAGSGFYSTGHVACPAGYRATGGGYQAGRKVKVIGSWPESGISWAVRGTSTTSASLTYTIYVRCAKL